MKRELKAFSLIASCAILQKNRKAHPDEKGTESVPPLACSVHKARNRKAHPDEKGTESQKAVRYGFGFPADRKAHPDEKGTESTQRRSYPASKNPIARPIPMKRELKVFAKRLGSESIYPSQRFCSLRSIFLPWVIFLCPSSKQV